MSITNLLPWRQQRRARCLRVWGALSAATFLLTLVVTFSLRMHEAVTLRALRVELSGRQAVQRALMSRQVLTAQTETSAGKPQPVAWQPVLDSLAEAMPPQAWLTELRYQPPSLVLIGYATTLPALTAMRDALRHITGFTPGPAGELQQNSQGRWMFTFQLNRQG